MRSRAAADEAALEQAQEIIFDAWEAPSAKQRVALAEKALTISPLCADAYVLLAQHAEPGSDKALDLWRKGVDAGRKAIGEDDFRECAGEFWGYIETRPYMRALFGLARALRDRRLPADAIEHLRQMLQLNPNDNQGARYALAALLVEESRDVELGRLLEQYPDEISGAWLWTAALAAFRRDGATERSREQLKAAVAENKHVPPFILGQRKIPKSLPPYMTPGGVDEAIYYALDCRAGWLGTQGAIEWMRSCVPAPKKSRRQPTR